MSNSDTVLRDNLHAVQARIAAACAALLSALTAARRGRSMLERAARWNCGRRHPLLRLTPSGADMSILGNILGKIFKRRETAAPAPAPTTATSTWNGSGSEAETRSVMGWKYTKTGRDRRRPDRLLIFGRRGPF